jgi:hypothetical protein
MADGQDYEAFDPKTGRKWTWDAANQKWNPAPTTGPSGAERLWEAANAPVRVGRGQKGETVDISRQMRESISNLASRIPERYAALRGPAAFTGNVLTTLPGAIAEFGRRVTTPLGLATGGAGALMQELRALGAVPGAVKTAAGLAETGLGAGFGAKGLIEATRGKQKGESDLDYLERVLSGTGQAMLGGAAVGHAVAPTVKTVAREVAGGGPTMEKLLAAKDMNALNLRSNTLQPLEKAVHDDAQSTIRTAIDKMEVEHPQAIQKQELGERVQADWDQFVRVEEKIPGPIARLLEAQEAEAPRTLTPREETTANAAAGKLRQGESVEQIRNWLRRDLRMTPKQVDAIMSVVAPDAGDTDFWGPAELQQLRSDLGRVAFGSTGANLPGPVRTAAVQSYRTVSAVLEDIANRSNVRQTWNVGNNKWKVYLETFDGKYENGTFQASPFAKALAGQTGDQMMDALSQGRLQWTRDLTTRYGRFKPNALREINQAVGRHQMLDRIESFSHPSKWEAATALSLPFAPHVWEAMAALRLLSPPMMRLLATRGVSPVNVRRLAQVEPGLPIEPPSPAEALLSRAAPGQHVRGTHYTDQGLRQTFSIPHTVMLDDLVRQGAIERNPDGTFSVKGEGGP